MARTKASATPVVHRGGKAISREVASRLEHGKKKPQTPSTKSDDDVSSTTSEEQPAKVDKKTEKETEMPKLRGKPTVSKKESVKSEIKHQQNSDKLCIRRAPFVRVVRDIVQKLVDSRATDVTAMPKISANAITALHDSTEARVVELFTLLNIVSKDSKVATVLPRHYNLLFLLKKSGVSLLTTQEDKDREEVKMDEVGETPEPQPKQKPKKKSK